jgi:multiple antibiotic resistance protein
VEFFLKSFLTLFVVMDPVGLVPVFLALAGDRPPREQARIARKAVLVAGAVLSFFFFFGRELLAYLGISLDALRVAGGRSSRDFCGFFFRGPKRAHVQVTPESPVLTVFP